MMSLHSKYSSKVALFILFISFFSVEIIAQKEEGTLPVEIIYFRAFAVGDSVWLQWGTATEVNNYGFNVQRSSKDNQWELLGFVQGNGNSHSPKHYEYWDLAIPKKDTYFYRLEQMDTDGKTEYSDTIMVDLLSSVIDDKEEIPTEFNLYQNYPNPFNPVTTIRYSIPSGVETSYMTSLRIYDVLGNEVATLVNEPQTAGNYEVKFNSSHPEHGRSMASGVYYYKLQSGSFVQVKKLIIMK